MAVDNRAVVYRLVLDYLVSEGLASADEVESAFEAVYTTLQAQRTALPPTSDDRGLGFDATLLGGSALALASYVALRLLEATMKAGLKAATREALDRAEEAIARETGRRKIVRGLRRRLDLIIEEL